MRDGRGAEEGTGALVCPDQAVDVLAQRVSTAAGLIQEARPVLARARDRGVEQRVDALPVVPHCFDLNVGTLTV